MYCSDIIYLIYINSLKISTNGPANVPIFLNLKFTTLHFAIYTIPHFGKFDAKLVFAVVGALQGAEISHQPRGEVQARVEPDRGPLGRGGWLLNGPLLHQEQRPLRQRPQPYLPGEQRLRQTSPTLSSRLTFFSAKNFLLQRP